MPTPEERAQKVVTEWLNTYGAMYHDLVAMIAAAIAETEAIAIAEERAVCRALALSFASEDGYGSDDEGGKDAAFVARAIADLILAEAEEAEAGERDNA